LFTGESTHLHYPPAERHFRSGICTMVSILGQVLRNCK